ncbi:MAG: YbhB/YbcL family Raf kinase inhibitor-like protein, partial [Gammaproteobacteria bacterium]|nr:YbhB/YbcL family Raf kinase inhibitor-like protein [Gemmatimonadota bacterium]NIU78104.1 YbhB/YbcL family Raf kinase inhibitor-like protein [Gammaproteobacteria bacterium]
MSAPPDPQPGRAPVQLRSDAFEPGQQIPLEYTRDGRNVSPPLRWSGLPPDTLELALVFEDTTEPFVHWLLYKIPADLERLPEGIQHKEEAAAVPGALQGRNSLGNVGYDGPLGTVGRTVHYRFRLYALDAPLDVPPGLDRDGLEDAMAGHVLA